MTTRDHPIAEVTLGLFVHGIPAIFTPITVAMGIDPRLRSYLRFYREGRRGDVTTSVPWDQQLCEGYELLVAPIHETRHFHDALLSWHLFELFLLCVMRE